MWLAKRKWGWYFVMLDRKHFKVKLLRFSGKQRMSRQYHKHRDELWLFLSGKRSGQWKVNKAKFEHTYTGGRCFVLEVQYGERCDEGDIVRL